MDIEKLNEILELVEKYNSRLLPVIKGRNSKDILKLYDEGLREFGENRLNELLNHKEFLSDSNFHFIAPLQSRKIKQIMDNCDTIHTLSRNKEIKLINNFYKNQDIFVQINIDEDPNKSGINLNDIENFFDNFDEFNFFPSGIMCIPRLDLNPKKAFNQMYIINEKLKKNFKFYKGELSMGMSNDYEIALDYGATIIRVGSKIFN